MENKTIIRYIMNEKKFTDRYFDFNRRHHNYQLVNRGDLVMLVNSTHEMLFTLKLNVSRNYDFKRFVKSKCIYFEKMDFLKNEQNINEFFLNVDRIMNKHIIENI